MRYFNHCGEAHKKRDACPTSSPKKMLTRSSTVAVKLAAQAELHGNQKQNPIVNKTSLHHSHLCVRLCGAVDIIVDYSEVVRSNPAHCRFVFLLYIYIYIYFQTILDTIYIKMEISLVLNANATKNCKQLAQECLHMSECELPQ